MNGDLDLLIRRLIGAATVFLAAFLLSLLLPPPDQAGDAGNERVLLRLPQSQPRSFPEADAADGKAPAETGVGRDSEAGSRPSSSARPAAPAPAPSRPQREAASAAASLPEPAPSTVADAPAAKEAGNWWIQAAAYGDAEAAQRGRKRVEDAFSQGSRLREVTIDGRRYWRLQVGPLKGEAAAKDLADRLRDTGFQGARAFREGER